MPRSGFQLHLNDFKGLIAGILTPMLCRLHPGNLPGLDVEFFDFSIGRGYGSIAIGQPNTYAGRVLVHHTLVVRADDDSQNPNLVILKYHLVMLWVYFGRVLGDPGECH